MRKCKNEARQLEGVAEVRLEGGRGRILEEAGMASRLRSRGRRTKMNPSILVQWEAGRGSPQAQLS